MKNREQDIQSHWKEIEATAERWSRTLHTEYPVLPLSLLKPHWDAVTRDPRPLRELQRAQALQAENLALKNELALLRRRFGIAGPAVAVPHFLNADRSTAN